MFPGGCSASQAQPVILYDLFYVYSHYILSVHTLLHILNLYDFRTFRRGTAPLLELLHLSPQKIMFELPRPITMCLQKIKPRGCLFTSLDMGY